MTVKKLFALASLVATGTLLAGFAANAQQPPQQQAAPSTPKDAGPPRAAAPRDPKARGPSRSCS